MTRLWLLAPLLLMACSAEMGAVFGSLLHNLAIVVPFFATVVVLVFLVNHFILHKRGRTNERACSVVGLFLFPPLFAAAFYLLFGGGWIPMTAAVVFGALTGWFSYTLDEAVEHFWEERAVTVPGLLGLLAGGWLIATAFTGVWLEGNMSVTHEACARRVVIERYDCVYDPDDKDDDCSWDYRDHVDRFALGRRLPSIEEGRDYKLGRGDFFRRDRIRQETYQFIGGNFWSEKHARWQPFRWLRLKKGVRFELGTVQRVRSNFYGNPIANGGRVEFGDASVPPPKPVKRALPSPYNLPPPTGVGKVFSFAGSFLGMLFREKEYGPLLWGVIGTVMMLAVLAIFVPAARPSIVAFAVAATVVLLPLIMIAAGRKGRASVPSSRAGQAP